MPRRRSLKGEIEKTVVPPSVELQTALTRNAELSEMLAHYKVLLEAKTVLAPSVNTSQSSTTLDIPDSAHPILGWPEDRERFRARAQ